MTIRSKRKMELIIERTIEDTSFDEVIELAIKASLSEEDIQESLVIFSASSQRYALSSEKSSASLPAVC